jgi:hypothetical protein
MKGQKLAPGDMHPAAKIVPAGVVEIIKRQKEGYAYIRQPDGRGRGRRQRAPVGPCPRHYALGGMFWFCENRFAGSYLAFNTDSRSKLGP